MKVLFTDTETTGVDTDFDMICEAAFKLVEIEETETGLTGTTLERLEFFVNPGMPIPFSAMGVHNITNEMVQNEPTIYEREEEIKAIERQADFICAHNLDYDYKILSRLLPNVFRGPSGHTQPIDTLRWIKHIYPKTHENYKLTTLMYQYGLNKGVTGEAHRAMFDVDICHNLFLHLYEQKPMAIAELPEFIASPLMIHTMYFGKHRGMEVSEMLLNEVSYVKWLKRQKWFKVEHLDLAYTIAKLQETEPSLL